MKFEQPVNPNYAATVVRVHNLEDLPNSDNLQGIRMFGMQAIVSRGSVQLDDLGLLFPTECQLGPEYAKYNNMYHHTNLNADSTITGYMEDNRRVRAIKLRGNRSDCLFMPIKSLACYGIHNFDAFTEGMVFDHVDKTMLCRKYELPSKAQQITSVPRRKPRVSAKVFPEHYDTTHFLRVEDNLKAVYPSDTEVIITQKLHGTLLRVGCVPVTRDLSVIERIAKFVGVNVTSTKYATVFGSHHVIKDVDNGNQRHYYETGEDGTDLWTYYGRQFADLIPKDYVVYGELVGFTQTGKQIQPGYTYNAPPFTAQWYVYRVAFVNSDGLLTDLAWPQLKEFCTERGLKHVVELGKMPLWAVTEAFLSLYMDTTFTSNPLFKRTNAVPLSKDSPCDEGVVLRLEGIRPQMFKAKSPIFVAKETHQLDKAETGVE